jgi:hypothetical protein
MTTRRCGKDVSTWVVMMAVALGLAWLAGGRAFAADNSPPLRFQGVLMERQGETLIINERPLLLTRETKVLSRDGTPLPESQLVPGQWVAVVAEPSSSGQQIKRIYLLPRRLNGPEQAALLADQSD